MPNMQSSRQKAREENLQAHKVSDTEYIVYNPTSKSQYSVLKSGGGAWGCTCPFAQKGSKLNGAVCKHLARVLDKETGCTGCGNKNIRLTDRRCGPCKQLDRLDSVRFV